MSTPEQRARRFIQWQLRDRTSANINWSDALREVLSIMDGNPPHPDLLKGREGPLCPPELLGPETMVSGQSNTQQAAE